MTDDELEHDDEHGDGLTTVDAYDVDDIALALRAIEWTEKERAMVRALASAPDRALSRLALARAVGSDSVNSTNSVLGNFCKALAIEIDPDLLEEWKPTGATSRGDWVAFACYGAENDDPVEGDPDTWRFVMREELAKALDQIGFAPFVASQFDTMIDDEEDEDGDDPTVLDDIEAATEAGELDNLSATEREAVVLARIGQGRFRDALLERWGGRCAVTGVSVEAALVASHIKPWAHCTNAERLDPDNGLLLVGTLDRLFDYGLITFDGNGRIRVSPRVPEEAYGPLGMSRATRLRAINDCVARYLKYHSGYCFHEPETETEIE